MSIHAERSFLGAVLLSEGMVPPRLDGIEPDHFTSNEHASIHRAMCEQFDASEPVDEVCVSRRMGGKPTPGELAKYTDDASTTATIDHHALIIKSSSRRREYLSQLKIAMSELSDGDNNADTVATDLIDSLSAAATDEDAQHTKTTDQLVREEFQSLENRKGKPNGLSTGFESLDNAIGGMVDGSMIVMAGRPSMGKTALAQNIAQFVAYGGGNVHCFSMEMSKEQLIQRSMSSEARVDLKRYLEGNLREAEWPKVAAAMNRVGTDRVAVCDLAGLTISRLRVLAKQRAVRYKPSLIVVDYLQLMGGDGRNREEEVSKVSRGLKMLAMELKCPIIAISQLNRGVESRTDKHPLMSDLRESGAIEQDADIVMLIYRDDYYNQASDRPGISDVNVAKNRNGPTGTKELKWTGEIVRFDEIKRPQGWMP